MTKTKDTVEEKIFDDRLEELILNIYDAGHSNKPCQKEFDELVKYIKLLSHPTENRGKE